jgi:hypothetical protein
MLSSSHRKIVDRFSTSSGTRPDEVTVRTRDEFLWHQMLLSLLYDNVFAHDETLVCSKKLARWFPDNESFRLLEQIVDCGGLGVLKRPVGRYPDDLQALALTQPITAREKHLEKFSVNNDGTPIVFDKRQREFHRRLEALLMNHPRVHRDAGLEKRLGTDLMQEFGRLLVTVLTDGRYRRWLKSRFKNITSQIAGDFVEFVDNPATAIARLERANQSPRFTRLSAIPVFSTALAVQVAATYPKREAKDLTDLIVSVFAGPFCRDEGAEGRYGRRVRDLPFVLEAEDSQVTVDDVMRVEVEVRISVRLPRMGLDYSEILGKVRESASGRNLRHAMNQLGYDPTFDVVKRAWEAVSADITSMASSSKTKEIQLRMVAISAGKGLLWGAMADFMLRPPQSLGDLPSRLPASLLGALFSVGGDLYPRLRKLDLERQRISRQLEAAVEFTCVRHPAIKAEGLV